MTTTEFPPAPDGATCEVDVPNGGRSVSFHRCGRPAKGMAPDPWKRENIAQCGIHLNAIRRRAAAAARRARERDESAALRSAAEAAIARLPEPLRTHARPETREFRCTGRVVVTLTPEQCGELLLAADLIGPLRAGPRHPDVTRDQVEQYLDDFERTNTLDGQHIDRDIAWDHILTLTPDDLARTRRNAERDFGWTDLTDAEAAGLTVGMSDGPWWVDDDAE